MRALLDRLATLNCRIYWYDGRIADHLRNMNDRAVTDAAPLIPDYLSR